MSNRLAVLLKDYPFEKGEPYFHRELKTLCNHFEEVLLFSNHIPINDKKLKFSIPDNATVINIGSANSISKISELFSSTTLRELFRSPINTLTRLRAMHYYLKESYQITKKIESYLDDRNILARSIPWYSYWSDELAFVLSQMKKKGVISTAVSRTHNHDIYEDRHPSNYLPFRRLIFENLDGIYCISEHGKEYLSSNYANYSSKFHCQRLGVENQVFSNRALESEAICLVSLSGIVPVKQLELIIEVLSKWNGRKISWHHLGSAKSKHYGNSVISLAETHLSNNENIDYKFHGFVKPNEVIGYLQQLNPHFLINSSTFEGIPVSMMEAFSLGIPVIGTDVCGVPELVENTANGYLFDPTKPEELSKIFSTIEHLDDSVYQNMRKKAQLSQREKFSAEKNYNILADILKQNNSLT